MGKYDQIWEMQKQTSTDELISELLPSFYSPSIVHSLA